MPLNHKQSNVLNIMNCLGRIVFYQNQLDVLLAT